MFVRCSELDCPSALEVFAPPGLLGQLRLRQSLGVAVALQHLAELCTAFHVYQSSQLPLRLTCLPPTQDWPDRVEVYHRVVLVSVDTRVPRRVAGCVSRAAGRAQTEATSGRETQ
jgi:hypothetical protein